MLFRPLAFLVVALSAFQAQALTTSITSQLNFIALNVNVTITLVSLITPLTQQVQVPIVISSLEATALSTDQLVEALVGDVSNYDEVTQASICKAINSFAANTQSLADNLINHGSILAPKFQQAIANELRKTRGSNKRLVNGIRDRIPKCSSLDDTAAQFENAITTVIDDFGG